MSEEAAVTSQLSALAAVEGPGRTQVSQLAMLAAYSPPSTLKTASSQLTMLVTPSGHAIPRTSNMAMLVAYKTGPREDFTQRAWTFTFDGHPFYVLTLGDQGTFVYDLVTNEWSEFVTAGLPIWNMQNGIVWQDRVIAADDQNPTVWELDPSSSLDDGFKAMTRKATAIIPARGRGYSPHYSAILTASVGNPSDLSFDATVTMRFSDDKGRTWIVTPAVTITDGDNDQRIEWRSLGSIRAPGRIIEISDQGGFLHIDGLDVEVEGLDDEQK